MLALGNRFAATIFHPDDLPAVKEHRRKLRALADGEVHESDYRTRHPDGTYRWLRTRATVFTRGDDGQVQQVIGVTQDITERKRVEEALREAQAHTESILSSVADSHILLDRQWRYLYVNTAAARAIGRPPEQILGRTLWELYPDIVGTELERQYQRVMDERLPITFDFHYATQDTDTWWENRFYPAPEGLALFATDITARKHAEAERAHLFEQLQRLSRQLLQAQEAERHTLARELHDEIGQRLTGLGMLLSTINQQLLPDVARVRLADAEALVRRLLEQVRSLALDLRPAMLDDLGLVPALLWLFERYTTQTQIVVRFEHLLQEEQRFKMDVETVAYRIVQEALTNVARHAGVTEVTVRLWTDGDILSMIIVDQGRGFTPQAVRTHTSIGLAGMAERAVLLGGDLTIESRPGAGTRVTAVLPS